MGVRHFSDLDAWKLSVELKRSVYGLTDSGTVVRDLKFRDQIRTAAASAPANIAEGFARFRHADFARFVTIAIASLDELETHLIDGVDRKHFGQEAIEPLVAHKHRTAAALTSLRKYLYRSQTPST